jgi:glycosyltransferase involved in cell wall biosynthesis
MVEPTGAPKISVCVITYNHKHYIAECLLSILNQKTDFDFEVIVGDDCSCDGTREIVRDFAARFSDKIRPVFQTENIKSGCNNYRIVHKLARGTYIAHMDGDDLMEPGKLQKQNDFLDQHPECSMVAHDSYRLSPDGCKTSNRAKDIPTLTGIKDLLGKHCYFNHSSKMYRSSIRDTSKVIDLPEFIDFELHIECAAKGWVGYINERLGVYRQSDNSMTKGSDKKIYQLFKYTLRGYDLAVDYGFPEKQAMCEKSVYIYKSAVFFMRRGSIEYACECFKRFDEIPDPVKSKIYSYLLFGKYKFMRTKVCQIIALVLNIRQPLVGNVKNKTVCTENN